MASTYDAKTITSLVQQLFSYPEGPLVLEWLEELYEQNHFKHIIQSVNPNAPLALSYQAGQADVVKTLKYVVKYGLQDDKDKDQETEEGIEYGR